MSDSTTPIAGVGPTDAIIENDQGGLQSPVPYRFDLLDPTATLALVDAFDGLLLERSLAAGPGSVADELNGVIGNALMFLGQHYKVSTLTPPPPKLVEGREITSYRFDHLPVPALFGLAGVLAEGAKKYAPNNWRLIPVADHVNHGLGHAFAEIAGDGQDDHLGHCFCRLHMGVAMALRQTDPTEGINWLCRAYVHSMLALTAKLKAGQ